MNEEEHEQERAEECARKIKDILNEYDFTIAGDWNGDVYIKNLDTRKTYDFNRL